MHLQPPSRPTRLPPSPLRFTFTFTSPTTSPAGSPILGMLSPDLSRSSMPSLSGSIDAQPIPSARDSVALPATTVSLTIGTGRCSQGRRADLRKEVAVKAHKSRQIESRADFLARLTLPPSPRSIFTPTTPPDSPGVFHFTLPSPGLKSPLTLFEELDGLQYAKDIRREEVDFTADSRARARELRESLGLGSPTERQLGRSRSASFTRPEGIALPQLPTLTQIAAKLRVSPSPTPSLASPRAKVTRDTTARALRAPPMLAPLRKPLQIAPRAHCSSPSDFPCTPSSEFESLDSPFSSFSAAPTSLSLTVSFPVDLQVDLAPSPTSDSLWDAPKPARSLHSSNEAHSVSRPASDGSQRLLLDPQGGQGASGSHGNWGRTGPAVTVTPTAIAAYLHDSDMSSTPSTSPSRSSNESRMGTDAPVREKRAQEMMGVLARRRSSAPPVSVRAA